ncbi:MAG: zinc ribbon domain-containing protein [Acidimicrobiales bacterium]
MDLSMTQLRHRRDHHPIRTRIAEIDEELAAHDASSAEVAERKHELDRQQKRLEDEVAMIADRRTNIDGKLYSGEVTASKELLALQDEAASLLSRQTEMEDDDLVIMEQVEVVEAELADFAEKRSVLESERTVQEAELAVAIEEIEAELAQVDAQRSTEASSATAELLERYESLRDEYGGVAVARLVGNRCDGCHMQLSAMAVDLINKMPDEAVVTCEECGRLLVR